MKSFDKLKTKLAELFQLDQADLDFGIYRIINARRDEITRFLENELLPQVQESFEEYRSSDKTEIQKELDQVIAGVRAAGMDLEQSPKVKELRARLATDAMDITALENEIYDHLYSFFSRYYDEGDFISLRRYKEGVYAIPYEGEEVKLYWANHAQYYVKTTEYFRDYTFKTPDDRRVHFKIVEADTEKDNIKAANGKERRFLLHGDKPVAEEDGELLIRFEYRPDDQKRKQDQINTETLSRITENLQIPSLSKWKGRLKVKWKRSNGTVSDKTILERHLYDYTRRNTFDYFIHKDLAGFLRRELDFYIKNEVIRLDDVENESAARVEKYLSKVKVIRKIAHKVIDFLSQIEDFQKKLWLKKKFVIEANYCMTLDRVPEELYPEIAANETQRQEWVRLFAIDEIRKDLAGAVGYSEPLTIEFLKANPFLIIDTCLFSAEFKEKLLSSLDRIDGQMNGLLINGDNFHALTFLLYSFGRSIKCIYIDPPYNTEEDRAEGKFVYKDDFERSSWACLLSDRLGLAYMLMADDGILFSSIDHNEIAVLKIICETLFSRNNFEGLITWRRRHNQPNDRTKMIGMVAEYLLAYAKNSVALKKAGVGKLDLTGSFSNPDNDPRGDWASKPWKVGSGQNGSRYRITSPTGKIMDEEWMGDEDTYKSLVADNRIIFPKKGDGFPRKKYFRSEREEEGQCATNWWEHDYFGHNAGANDTLTALFGVKNVFSNPKPVELVRGVIQVSGRRSDSVLDFFAGSGTTAHAVINLNREDGGSRKYVLIEMAKYFDTVLLPRIKKVVYSKDWSNGKPISRNTGISQMFKYIRLESYEDSLANIELKRMPVQQDLLEKSSSFLESYMLKYMLESEAKGSPSLLNIDQFEDPFNYHILVGTGSVSETRPVAVDLVETFNWLLGLKVRHMDFIQDFRIVEGTNQKDEKVLVIWRKVRERSETDSQKIMAAREKSNLDLEAFFKKQQYNTLDSEFDIIYVNGDNNLMNVPLAPEGGEPRYKVRLIEEEFKRLMFDVKDV